MKAWQKGVEGAIIGFALIIAASSNLLAPISAQMPSIVVVANEIDYGLASDFVRFLSEKGIEVVRADSRAFGQHESEKFIVILGGPDAYDGIGGIVEGILLKAEQDDLRIKGNRRMIIKADVFSYGQAIFIFAGSGREQTQLAHIENRETVYNDLKSHSASEPRRRLSCEKESYKMGFILLVNDYSQATPERLNKLSAIKNGFSKSFYEATGNRARMDTGDDIHILITNGSNFIMSEVTKSFSKENDDVYDFLSVYSAFPQPDALGQSYGDAFQNIKGIGRPLLDNSDYYGSKGKLRGITSMLSIDNYDTSDPIQFGFAINGLLHETGHQWCCYVGDNFARGEGGARLEIIQQGIHFYRGLQSPHGTTTPMNSDYWVPNNDGTFRREYTPSVEKYHPFQLYFMGLLPEEEYDTKFAVYDAGIVGKDFNDQNATFYKTVSVRDIIELEGERSCLEVIE